MIRKRQGSTCTGGSREMRGFDLRTNFQTFRSSLSLFTGFLCLLGHDVNKATRQQEALMQRS
jgi:hypothetical protein